MEQPMIRGDEVRRGTNIILDALSKDVITSLGDSHLSEQMLQKLHDGGTPLFPMTAQEVAQSAKTGGELVFAIRLLADKTIIGVCRLNNVDWKSRHAQLHISITDERSYRVDMLVEVIQTTLQFAYWEANLNRIYVHCLEDHNFLNTALAQVGLTHEGQLRQEVYPNGRYLDVSVYSMLQREWSG